MSRQYKDSGAIYRVHLDRLLADESAVYQSTIHGPYSNANTAKGQATLLLTEARTHNRKANVRIEKSATVWERVQP